MTALLLCPHCKAAPRPHPQNTETRNLVGDWRKAVWCESCGALGPECETEAEATLAWNRRAPSPAVVGLVEALEKLSRLGNGELPGNSVGNEIASAALAAYKQEIGG